MKTETKSIKFITFVQSEKGNDLSLTQFFQIHLLPELFIAHSKMIH